MKDVAIFYDRREVEDLLITDKQLTHYHAILVALLRSKVVLEVNSTVNSRGERKDKEVAFISIITNKITNDTDHPEGSTTVNSTFSASG